MINNIGIPGLLMLGGPLPGVTPFYILLAVTEPFLLHSTLAFLLG